MAGVDGKGQGGPKGITPGESVGKDATPADPNRGAAKLEGPNAKNKDKGGKY